MVAVMSRARSSLLALASSALLACGVSAQPADSTHSTSGDQTSTEASTDPATGSGTTGTGTSVAESSTSVATTSTGGQECEAVDSPMPSWTCNLWSDDCPAAQKCFSSEWTAAFCVPLVDDPRQVGEACNELEPDECVRGARCFLGQCHAYCGCSEIAPTCDDPCSVCSFVDGGPPPMCTIPCDPLEPHCEGVTDCVYNGANAYLCRDAQNGALGSPCSGLECAPGLACISSDYFAACEASRCCAQICRVGDDQACIEAVGPATVCLPSTESTGCSYDDVGFCGVSGR